MAGPGGGAGAGNPHSTPPHPLNKVSSHALKLDPHPRPDSISSAKNKERNERKKKRALKGCRGFRGKT